MQLWRADMSTGVHTPFNVIESYVHTLDPRECMTTRGGCVVAAHVSLVNLGCGV
jgi:hypothetical protein